ncbi:hypothetical protein VKT23_012446 [Stygiomarasmius scandens]|uniref:Uncharacterized protein n=1 Tax=Marasmiellus scandens TaxID=2682957 RepID=A0ABR1J635_9AGAR
MQRNTRSGRTFSEWSGPLLQAPEINLTKQIAHVLQAQDQSLPAEIPRTIEDTSPSPEPEITTTIEKIPPTTQASPEPERMDSTSVSSGLPLQPQNTRGRRGGRKHKNVVPQPPTTPLPPSNPPLPRSNRQVQHGHVLRKLTRQQLTKERGPAGHQTSSKTRQKHFHNSQPMMTSFDSSDIQGAETGYEELLEKGFREVEWDARESVPIVDAEGVIFGLMLGNPQKDPTWLKITHEAAGLLEQTRLEMDRIAEETARKAQSRGYQPKPIPNQRGDFTVVTRGNSFGGGQRYPKPLENKPEVAILSDNLISSLPFTRLAHHSASGFAAWAPRLHLHYMETLQKLRNLDLDLPQNFPSSIFAAATFNCGPQTITLDHLDFQNYVHGWCSITALGSFDYQQGGHLVLWDLGLIIQFPPGSTILIPSAYLWHSNTRIAPAESRYSFTQYTAGGLFRYAEDGGRVRKHMSPSELMDVKKQYRKLARQGLSMYSTLDELSSLLST